MRYTGIIGASETDYSYARGPRFDQESTSVVFWPWPVGAQGKIRLRRLPSNWEPYMPKGTRIEPPTEPSSEQPELAEPWSEHLAEPAPASVQTEPAPAGVQTETAPAGVQTQPKKRGRPKGSKNKPRKKAGQEQLTEQLQACGAVDGDLTGCNKERVIQGGSHLAVSHCWRTLQVGEGGDSRDVFK